MPIQLLASKVRAVFSVLRSSEQDHTAEQKPPSEQPDTDQQETASVADETTGGGAASEQASEDAPEPTDTADDDSPDYGEQAAAVSNAIIDELSPESSLHIGCGAGHHMKPFLDAGIDTYGVDPSSVALENAVVSEDLIEIYDLGYPYSPEEAFDLVVCLDTLEYVAERHADIIIQSISASGSTAVVSIPLAPHRPDTDAWVDKFAEHGMELDADATEQIEDVLTTADGVWVPDKVLVFNAQ